MSVKGVNLNLNKLTFKEQIESIVYVKVDNSNHNTNLKDVLIIANPMTVTHYI